MNHYTTGQLAEIRRQELTANAAYHRQIRRHRRQPSAGSRSHPRRPRNAFHGWLAAAQL
ncbi:MAG: hypothetical protein J2P16_12520 [Mycobacterium sp.]|nr:hypothetical protein [Mycobacterium sp.]